MHDLKFPLVPDDYHLRDVGKTKQGNGYWITQQLTSDGNTTRDFVAAYLFDKDGHFISADVVDLGLREPNKDGGLGDALARLRRKIDAETVEQIWVRPFSTAFFGETFGLVVREDEHEEFQGEQLIDALPGHTLMFYGPWDTCNYDT
ncbi:hypothetical protein [Cognatiyoonia sp. IB215182]|uniref:hypothetical protein n=1 Tax=Cognatiyoonia sp. IB215182 TaxID=3097353 RepID=UPI002A0F44CB|nr:hypothetical protein [Cognatiyoonia sp. IB215182]MDX8354666.1 hypothetical protein [Cognatiyoonia sp. IB215182]